jgi:hypothetical protein
MWLATTLIKPLNIVKLDALYEVIKPIYTSLETK